MGVFCKIGQLGFGAPQHPAFSYFLLSVLLQRWRHEGSASCVINCADDKFSSQQTSQSASRGPVISSTQRTTVETQNRHPNVEQICTEGWFISIIRVCCVDAFMRTRVQPPCAACTKHVIHGDVIRIPPSRSQFSLVPAPQ